MLIQSIRTFVPVVCCDHVAHSGPGWLRCSRCGASCRRDNAGVIVSYSATGAAHEIATEPQS